jgi:hypothetical protein
MTPLSAVSARAAYSIAAVGGVLLWVGASVLGGRREAWDSSLYWIVAYPASVALGGALGYLATDRPWRWGLTVMIAQAVTLAAMTFSFGLLPLGLILFSVLAVPPMLAARAGAWLRRRSSRA